MSAALTTNVDQRLLRTTKFPPEFNQKVDMSKVNIPLIKKWIAGEISRILKSEDDVVIDLAFNLIEGSNHPNIKELQISLTGFLDQDAAPFCKELWTLLRSAQSNPQGVPQELLEAKKLELIQEKLEEEKAREEARKREEEDRVRERELARIRDRERSERGRGRGRSGRYSGDYDRRAPRDYSRSPPPRRRYDDDENRRGPPPRREKDSYVPPSSTANRDGRRRRSPSYSRPASRSRTPPARKRRNTSSISMSPSPLRSPPRKRRSGIDRSPSRDRMNGRHRDRHTRGDDDRRRHRSQHTRRRSRSPRRHCHRSPSSSRSPPPKRSRRQTVSVSRSPPSRRAATHDGADDPRSPPRRKRRSSLSSEDLMNNRRADARKDRHGADARRSNPRLSRSTSRSSSRSRSPPRRDRKRRGSVQRQAPERKRRRNTSSVEVEDKLRPSVDAGAVEAKHVPEQTTRQKAIAQSLDTDSNTNSQATAPRVKLSATELREKLLKQKLIARSKSVQRADSGLDLSANHSVV